MNATVITENSNIILTTLEDTFTTIQPAQNTIEIVASEVDLTFTTIQPAQNTIEIVASEVDLTFTTIQPAQNTIEIVASEVDLTFTDVGVQGIRGARGADFQYTWSATSLGVKSSDDTNYVFVDLKGQQGDIGAPLEFNNLTEEQKQELRGDVGDTSTNYTNIFLNSLLS